MNHDRQTGRKHNTHNELWNVKPLSEYITSSEQVPGTGANCDTVERGKRKGRKQIFIYPCHTGDLTGGIDGGKGHR
jgi:hypothetical protein